LSASQPRFTGKIFNKAVEASLGVFGQEMRRNGAMAIKPPRFGYAVRLSLNSRRREHEGQTKAANEQKARASVPSF
jgi:hypothetical protein